MAEPITNVGRVTVGAFTNSLFKRWEKIISRIKKSNAKAASAIARIPPYSQHIFGGDHTQLAIVGARKSSQGREELKSLHVLRKIISVQTPETMVGFRQKTQSVIIPPQGEFVSVGL